MTHRKHNILESALEIESLSMFNFVLLAFTNSTIKIPSRQRSGKNIQVQSQTSYRMFLTVSVKNAKPGRKIVGKLLFTCH